MPKNWKTTVSGIGGMLVAAGVVGNALVQCTDGDLGTAPDWNAVAVAVGVILHGLGLMKSKDHDQE